MIEQELKALILQNYKSVKAFAENCGIAYTTVDSMLKRGVGKTSITNIIKICDVLNISCDALADGKIIPKKILELSEAEEKIINAYRSLNAEGQERLIEYTNLLENSLQYKKGYIVTMVEEA